MNDFSVDKVIFQEFNVNINSSGHSSKNDYIEIANIYNFPLPVHSQHFYACLKKKIEYYNSTYFSDIRLK